MTKALLGAAFAVALLGTTAVASADQRHHDMSGGSHFGDVRGDRYRGNGFSDMRFRTPAFSGDRDAWRGGHWRHERHNGRFGWWWVVGDFWGFYPEPIYPYPDYAYDESAAGGVWYYCEHPRGYYPYVRRCDVAWEQVPAEPE